MADIIQFNCNGLRAQSTFIRQLLCEFQPKVMLLQELRCTSKALIKFRGYTLITHMLDQSSNNFPSVGMLIRDDIQFQRISTPRN